MKKALILVSAAMAFFSFSPGAMALFGDADKDFGLDGSVRATGIYSDNYDFPAFFGDHPDDKALDAALRVTAGGRPTDQFQYELHLVQAYDYSSVAEGGFFSTEPAKPLYRAPDDTCDEFSDAHNQATLWVDRANVKLSFPGVDVTIGRQALTFGKAYFWNPQDVFMPFGAFQFDRDYKPGVDALRVEVPFSRFSGFTLVGAFGRETDLSGKYTTDKGVDAGWYGSALLGRLFANFSGWDLAVDGGKVYGGYHLSAGAVGEVEGISMRAEAAQFFADNDGPDLPAPLAGPLYKDHFTGVMGLGHRFQNSLDVEIEYLYDSLAGGDLNAAWVRYEKQVLLQMSEHVLGATASYEITPIALGRLTFLRSLNDGSMAIQPLLTISLSDESEVLFGANVNLGERPEMKPLPPIYIFGQPVIPGYTPSIESEFGAFPTQMFLEIKQYF